MRSACCESLSQKSKIFASSLSQGSLFAPGIVLWCDTGLFLFLAFNRQRGNEEPKIPQTQTGAETTPPAPEPKRRVNLPMVPPGGFLRGEQFERERVVPPLSRLLCFLSCRSKKGRPCWQALAESRLENRLKGYNRVSIPTSKYHPKIKPLASCPLAPSVTCGDSSLRSGAVGLVPCHIGLLGMRSACCESLSRLRRQLPLAREPLVRALGSCFFVLRIIRTVV